MAILLNLVKSSMQAHFKWASGLYRFNAHIPNNDGVVYFDYGNNTSYRLEIHNLNNLTGNIGLWAMRISENQKQVFRGTSSITPIYDQVRGFAELPQNVIAAFIIGSGNGGGYCRMDLYSFLIYYRALPDVELKSVFRYFKDVYNLSN